MSRSRIAWIALLLSPMVAAGAEPANLWISFDPPAARPGEPVRVEIREGAPFAASAKTVRASAGDRFQRLWKQGRVDLDPGDARFAAEGAGLHLVVFHAPGGDRFAKGLVVVGTPKVGDPLRWSEVGQTLEIVPQSDPAVLALRGGALELQVLFEREPLAGVVVEAVREGDPTTIQRARTDEIGVTNLKLEGSGRWLVRTEHRGECFSCEDGRTRTFAATLVLGVAVTKG